MAVDIDSIFEDHPPLTEGTVLRHSDVRTACRLAATVIDNVVPESAEKILAIRKLQEAMMYANSGIAQHYRPV